MLLDFAGSLNSADSRDVSQMASRVSWWSGAAGNACSPPLP